MLLQGISLPSPPWRGAGGEAFSLERGVKCYATTKLTSEKCNAITRHITPLSPWRGVGGEAFLPTILPIFRRRNAECFLESVVETRGMFETTTF